jgi:hypothetical protein
MASNFTNLAGGQTNAVALVTALRTGSEVTFTTTTPATTEGGTATVTTTTFAPPTKPMGWGNVKHALSLAQYQLTQAGITQPTPAQLQAALMGGDVSVTTGTGDSAVTKTTTLKGILTLRADGMGWGKIAQTVGTKLGPVNSTIKATNASLTQQNASTTTTTTANGTTSSTALTTKSGVTTAAGTTAAVGHGNGARGITTATGATASSGIVNGGGNTPHGNAFGKGMVSASGGAVSASTSGVTTAQGSGNGNNAGGNGHGKGKSGG